MPEERYIDTVPVLPRSEILNRSFVALAQDLVDDYHKKLDADGLKAAYRARAINVEQTMRVNGKTLEGNDFISQAVERLEQASPKPCTGRCSSSRSECRRRMCLLSCQCVRQLGWRGRDEGDGEGVLNCSSIKACNIDFSEEGGEPGGYSRIAEVCIADCEVDGVEGGRGIVWTVYSVVSHWDFMLRLFHRGANSKQFVT